RARISIMKRGTFEQFQLWTLIIGIVFTELDLSQWEPRLEMRLAFSLMYLAIFALSYCFPRMVIWFMEPRADRTTDSTRITPAVVSVVCLVIGLIGTWCDSRLPAAFLFIASLCACGEIGRLRAIRKWSEADPDLLHSRSTLAHS